MLRNCTRRMRLERRATQHACSSYYTKSARKPTRKASQTCFKRIHLRLSLSRTLRHTRQQRPMGYTAGMTPRGWMISWLICRICKASTLAKFLTAIICGIHQSCDSKLILTSTRFSGVADAGSFNSPPKSLHHVWKRPVSSNA